MSVDEKVTRPFFLKINNVENNDQSSKLSSQVSYLPANKCVHPALGNIEWCDYAKDFKTAFLWHCKDAMKAQILIRKMRRTTEITATGELDELFKDSILKIVKMELLLSSWAVFQYSLM